MEAVAATVFTATLVRRETQGGKEDPTPDRRNLLEARENVVAFEFRRDNSHPYSNLQTAVVPNDNEISSTLPFIQTLLAVFLINQNYSNPLEELI